jgi:ketosteroid isomerase-like protein
MHWFLKTGPNSVAAGMMACVSRSSSAAMVILALASGPALAAPPQSERTAAAVMRVEHQWLAALQRHDVGTLARILGQEFIDSDFQGDAITRAQFLAYFAHPGSGPAPAVKQSFHDTKVRFIADGDVAIVTGVVVTEPAATSNGGGPSNSAAVRHSRFTDVFVWRDGRWQAVTGQETHFTPGEG